ncbi:MAG TPA: ATP-binding protein [Acidobacteriota bacterium]|nr:ATP-binding protein [Acidobacteriota bacterium]
MSLKSLSRATRKIGFQISVRYTTILILCALLLFFACHFGLTAILADKDKESIQEKLTQLSSLYQKSGITAVTKNVETTRDADIRKNLFVRVASSGNEDLYSTDPDDFEDFDIETAAPEIHTAGWVTLHEKGPDEEFEILKRPEVLEIATKKMGDGTLIQVGKSSEYREDFMAMFRWALALLLIPVVLIAGALLSFRTLRPLQSLVATLKEIELGKMESRVPVRGNGDELDELATLFNHMLERIETLVVGMRSSLDNVAHDLRTPIARFRAIAESALQSEQNGNSHREALADCLEESERIVAMLDTLMDISEAETGSMKLNLEIIDVANLIHETIELYRYVAEDKQITVSMSCDENLRIKADPNRIRQVLANLLDNAIKYTEPKGSIELKAQSISGEVVIFVKDTGIGIVVDELPRIWERLYRSDVSRSKRGLGLGLSLVRAVVNTHGGHAEAFSEGLGSGSIFKISFPEVRN